MGRNNFATLNKHRTPQEKGRQGSAYCRSAEQQIFIRLQGGTVELTLDPIQRFEALKASLGILGQLLHWKKLLEKRQAVHIVLATSLSRPWLCKITFPGKLHV